MRIEKLIPAARGGSSQACDDLWALVRNYLLLIANQELSPELRAKVGGSDIVQETLIGAQRGIGRFEGRTRADLLAWLRRILRNHIAEASRQHLGRLQTAAPAMSPSSVFDAVQKIPRSPGETPSRVAMAEEEAARIGDVLAQLSAEYRDIIRLRTWERRSFVEIGESLNCTADAARKLWARAIDRFERVWSAMQAE